MQLSNAIDSYVRDLDERMLSDAHIWNVNYRLGRFLDWLGDESLDEIDRLTVAKYFRHEESSGLADGSLAGFRSTQKAFWNFCDSNGWCEGNLASRVKRYSYRPRKRQPAPEDDIRKVVKLLPAYAAHRDGNPVDVRNALIVRMSIDSGCRRGALYNLTLEAMENALSNPLKTEAGQLAYVARSTGKTGPCSVVFFADSAAFYRDWYELRSQKSPYVFTSTRTGKRLTRDALGSQFAKVCRWCGVKRFTSHAIRKANVTGVVQLAGLVVGRDYAEHSRTEVTAMHYVTVSREEVVSAAAELNARRRVDPDTAEMARFFGISS